ncbi:MAG: lysozyme [Rickettsiaceae bacterium]|nr:lysozyme [Rickettsiaceae bacterium]
MRNTLKLNRLGLDLIKKFEGFQGKVYVCPGGYKTIGYGHKILPGEKFGEISLDEAELLLEKDLQIVQNTINRNIKASLNDNQFSALASFTMNLGAAALQRSSLRQKINYGADKYEVASEFLRWVYSNGAKLRGLIIRRKIESILYSI